MRRRIPETYTVMIARTGREPTVISMQPIALWLVLTSLAAFILVLVVVSFLLGSFQGQSSKRTALFIPRINVI